MKFVDLRLAEPLLRALETEGYTIATPIQAEAIPHVLAGRDVIGVAQTGTGKTAAFALPILHRLAAGTEPTTHQPRARCLVLCPTRELATQIEEGFRTYGRNLQMRRTVIFGGVNQRPQVDALRRGLDIIVATPGRLLDLMQQGHVDLSRIEVIVLDEADRMLDMGFIHDIKRICGKLPAKKQTMLFSATMPTEIRRLADEMMKDPAVVRIAPPAPAAERIEQCVYFVDKRNKPQLLAHLVEHMPMSRTIVFTRTKHGADRVVRQLHRYEIKSEAIHGNKSQNARQRALENFRSGRVPVLVATDVASRGIDIDDISHVVNFDVTHEPETYIHRIGRTARAGASGMAVSFCDQDERSNLRAIERLIKKSIPVRDDHPKYEPMDKGYGDGPNDFDHDRNERSDRRTSHSSHGSRGGQRQPQRHEGGRGHSSGGHSSGGHASSGRSSGGQVSHGHKVGSGVSAHSTGHASTARPHAAKPNVKPNVKPHAKPHAPAHAPQGARAHAPQGARPHAPQSARPHAPQSARPHAPAHAPQGARPHAPQGARANAPAKPSRPAHAEAGEVRHAPRRPALAGSHSPHNRGPQAKGSAGPAPRPSGGKKFGKRPQRRA